MDLGIDGRVALVTGASRGIGRAVAARLAAEGACVLVGYRTGRDAAESVVAAIAGAGGRAIAVGFDHTEPAGVRDALATLPEEWSPVRILVANAGSFPRPGPFSGLDDDGWRSALREQLEGPGNVVRAVLPGMLATGWGRIVLVSTVHAAVGNPGVVAHTAAKSGLHGLTRSLAREVGAQGVLVNAVLPGLTLTEEAVARFPAERIAASEAVIPTGHASRPEDVAALIAFLASARNGNVTGELVRSAGGI
ncbi:MAG: SDR family NAD(P)-dependent oxidoreductase [Microbacterium sp.]|uniref:SDR family oxidoreductase n=1 Tax=Microbacterium sp. TaxID=51671 RepID=UPI0039E69DBA